MHRPPTMSELFGWVTDLFRAGVREPRSYDMLYDAMFRFIHGISDTVVSYGTGSAHHTGHTDTAPLYSDPAQYALTMAEVAYVLTTDWNHWNSRSFHPAHWEFLQAFISRWRTLGGTFFDLTAWIVAAMGNPGAAGPMAARIGMEERDLKF